MRKKSAEKIFRPLLAALLLVMLPLSACRSTFEAEYSYAAMYNAGEQLEEQPQEAEIKSYTQLTETLQGMVSGYQKHGVLRFSNYSGSVSEDLAAACREIRTAVPIGVYAVKGITYELERIVSYYTAEVSIDFGKTRDEIESVITLNGTAELNAAIIGAMASGEEKLTVRIYSSVVSEEYIREIITDTYYEQPLFAAARPEPGVKSYPTEGLNRIYEISFGWQETTEQLAEMKERLFSEVGRICSTVGFESAADTALELALRLSQSCTESENADSDTAYGALVNNESGSLGMAMAYKALCDRKGIECRVVRGSIVEARLSEHFWNMIELDGDYYHIDISRMMPDAEKSPFPAGDAAMWGEYVWDTELYPVCGGPLSSYVVDIK